MYVCVQKSNDKRRGRRRRHVVKIMLERVFFFYTFCCFFPWNLLRIHAETIDGCTINNNDRRSISSNKTSVTLSCSNNGYILVRNLTFGVHKTSTSSCTYQSGDCITRTTYIGMECNGLRTCNLDLNPQYLHICSQYSDYMMLDYSCLQGQSLSVCDNQLISTSTIDSGHRLFLRSPNYPNEYENSLNCSCEISSTKSTIAFLDFYLEERDEMNLCSRDYLQIDNRTFCDSSIDQSIQLNASAHLTFRTNDVITRKGFWLMINSKQPIEVTCRNSFERPFPTVSPSPSLSLLSTSLIVTNTTVSHLHHTRRFTLSFILMLTILFVVTLLLLNLILIILCWRQRRSKEAIHSKPSHPDRPFFGSKRSPTSSSSSITYGDTPVLTSLDTQKRQTTSTTTATTGIYEDPNELLTFQRQQKLDLNQSFYRHEPKRFCPILLSTCANHAGYNPIIHFPPPPMHCQFNDASHTFHPLDSQHIYETIQDGQCPYQRLAATLRRQQQQCTCYGTQNPSTNTEDNKDMTTKEDPNPETLV